MNTRKKNPDRGIIRDKRQGKRRLNFNLSNHEEMIAVFKKYFYVVGNCFTTRSGQDMDKLSKKQSGLVGLRHKLNLRFVRLQDMPR